MKHNQWQKLGSKYVLENPWYKVRQDQVIRPDGKEATYNVVECGTSVFVVPVTSENKILLVKLFRYTTQHEAWEIPAGGVEKGEQPLIAAKRELEEETGMTGESWHKIGQFESMNGITDSVAYVYEAQGLSETDHNEKEEEGITRVHAFSLEEIATMIQNGEIVDALSIAALMQYVVHLQLINNVSRDNG